MKTMLKIAVVLVIGASIICFLFIQYFSPHPNPRSTFKYLVMKPIPNSVTNVKEGDRIALDSVFCVLWFQISRTDLQNILDSQHFTPINEDEEFKRWDQKSASEVKIQKEDYLTRWKQNIQYNTKLDVNFTKSWQIFILKEGNGRKYFFFDTNSTEAVFVAEAN